MKIEIVQGDVTKVTADVIVNAANPGLYGGAGVCGAIHENGGRSIRDACMAIPELTPGVRCPTGQVRVTQAGMLPASFIIHAVGPIYDDHDHDDSCTLLRSCYLSAMHMVDILGANSIAFPAISLGIYRFPEDLGAEIALTAVRDAQLSMPHVNARFVLFTPEMYDLFQTTLHTLPPIEVEQGTFGA